MRGTNMLLSAAAGLLSFSTLSQAIPFPQAAQIPENGTMDATASGYKNVAYFVNWVCLSSSAPPDHY
jgi:hypothetical protein